MLKDRPGAIGFTSGFSQDSISITVGEQIITEQLIEKCIVMRISRHDHLYRDKLKQYDIHPIFLSLMATIQYMPCCP